MKRIRYIFLTNQYLPTPGATGVCVHQVAKYMALQGEDVYVVCYGKNQKSGEVIDGIKVIRVKEPFFIKTQSCGFIMSFVSRMTSLLLKFIYIKKYPLRSNLLVRRFVNSVLSLQQQGVDSVIIASYTPLEAVIAAAKCKEKNIASKIIYYSTDTLSNEKGDLGFLSANKRTNLGLKWERKLFALYDRIIIMECHKDHYTMNAFGEFANKISFASFPLIVKPESSYPVTQRDSYQRIVFAGNLYKKMRNPIYICGLINSVARESNLKAIFVGGGDCVEELERICEASNGIIKYVGFKPHSYVEQELFKADMLLSIGNSFSEMCPSKIYEYMSTGKPIIHTYTYEKDP